MANPADPPSPIPAYLTPWAGERKGSPPIGPEDMRIAPATNDLVEIARLIEREELQDGQCLVTQRDGSPWIELDVAKHGDVQRFALWRYTGAIYRIGPFGAVDDDPIQRPPE